MTEKPFGDEEIRTPDILLAKQALYQLSYVPAWSRFGDVNENPTRVTREPVRGRVLARDRSRDAGRRSVER